LIQRTLGRIRRAPPAMKPNSPRLSADCQLQEFTPDATARGPCSLHVEKYLANL